MMIVIVSMVCLDDDVVFVDVHAVGLADAAAVVDDSATAVDGLLIWVA